MGGQVGGWTQQEAPANFSEYLCVFVVLNALSADGIPAIARAMTASMDEAGVQGRDEEAASTQGPPHEKRLLDEGRLPAIEGDAAAPAPSSLPPGEPVGVLLCLLSNVVEVAVCVWGGDSRLSHCWR